MNHSKPHKTAPPMTRRQFTQRAASSALALGITARSARETLGANERVNIGVIGCGGRARSHIGLLMNLGEEGRPVNIAAVCDTYRPRLESAKQLARCSFATMRHEELLAREDIDAVLIATPEHWHGYQSVDAMRAGKDVYCEKPLTHWRQLGLGELVAQTARETGRILQVGSQRMSSPVYPQAKALIEKGAIGKPVMAETGYFRFGDWGERGMRIDDPKAKPGPDLDWDRFLGDCPRREFDVSRYFRWRMYYDTAGGPISDNYVHFYNPLAYVLDLKYPVRVAGTGGILRYTLAEAPDPEYGEEREVPDTCNVVIDYPNDITVTCVGTQANAYTTFGSNETPIIRGWEGAMLLGEREIRVVRADNGEEIHREPVEGGIDQKRFWIEFLGCCRTRNQPLSNAELSAPVNTTMQMAVMAVRGERVMRYDFGKAEVIA